MPWLSSSSSSPLPMAALPVRLGAPSIPLACHRVGSPGGRAALHTGCLRALPRHHDPYSPTVSWPHRGAVWPARGVRRRPKWDGTRQMWQREDHPKRRREWEDWSEEDSPEAEQAESKVNIRLYQNFYGLLPVLAVLRAKRRECKQLLLDRSGEAKANLASERDISAWRDLEALGRELQEGNWLQVHKVSPAVLSGIAKSSEHEGVVLVSEFRPKEVMHSLPVPKKGSLWILAMGITDHMNLAKLVRSAIYFDAEGIVVPSVGSSDLGVHECVATAGASETFPFFHCGDVPRLLRQARYAGYFVLGTGPARSGETVECWSCGGLAEKLAKRAKPDPGVLLIIGAEGPGLDDETRSSCDALVEIPGGVPGLDSLNAGVATGIMLQSVRTALEEL